MALTPEQIASMAKAISSWRLQEVRIKLAIVCRT